MGNLANFLKECPHPFAHAIYSTVEIAFKWGCWKNLNISKFPNKMGQKKSVYPHEYRACHGWSRCNGDFWEQTGTYCTLHILYIWQMNQSFTLASAKQRIFRLFFGQWTIYPFLYLARLIVNLFVLIILKPNFFCHEQVQVYISFLNRISS